MSPNPIRLAVIIRRRDSNTQREYCLMTDRGWSDTATSQGTPRIDSHHHELERGKEGFCSEFLKETNSAKP